MNFSTQIRHFLTGLAGIGTYLLSLGLLEPSAADAANSAGAALVDPMAAFLSILAVALVRWVMGLIGKLFDRTADKSSGGMSGGISLLILGMTAGFVGLSLLSCAPGTPVRVSMTGPHGSASYSAKGGLVIDLPYQIQRSGK